MSLSDYKPDDKTVWDEEELELMKRIIYVVGEKGASYPAEVARQTDYETGEIASKLNRLVREGHLCRLKPSKGGHDDDLRLLGRRPELFENGVRGIDRWRTMTWVALPMNKIITTEDGRTVNPFGEEIDKNEKFDKIGGPLEYSMDDQEKA